jgi:alkylation response protein AidB-like acyl-CoA dehydrogenase
VTDSAEHLFNSIKVLEPSICQRGGEIETGRRIPHDIVETLRSIGVFRMFVPHSHGGLELDLPAALSVVKLLAKIDGSLGWISMIAAGSAIMASSLKRETYDRIYLDGPDVIIAGSTAPCGRADAVDERWKISGRWPFASGCQHADLMIGVCAMINKGMPLRGPSGPLFQGFVLPASEWEIEDTWHVAGLKGTGSHHVALNGVITSKGNFFDFGGQSCLTGPLYSAAPQLVTLLHGAVALGIAEGALEDLITVTNGRRQVQPGRRTRAPETFLSELGRIGAELRAMTALLEMQATSHWQHACEGTLKNVTLLTQSMQTVTWVTAASVRAVDALFALAGSGAVYENSPLQRRMRDLHTAAQHNVVHARNYIGAGALLVV